MEQLVIMLRSMLVCTLAMQAAESSFYDDNDNFGLHTDFGDHFATDEKCVYRDEETYNEIFVDLGTDLTGELLSDCKVLYCDEYANTVYRDEEGCPVGVLCYGIGEEWTNPCGTYTCVGDRTPVFMASDGCMEDDVCHLEGSKWWSECTEKTCEQQEDGSFNVAVISVRQRDETWTETTANGCNLFECSQDGESADLKIAENPGCFFKKDGKCYAVGTTKKYVCSTIHCELDSTGDRATFTGLKLECLSLGQCIPLGTKWLNTDICLEKKCGKSVDEYGTELHIVERTKGCYMYDVCRPPGYTIQVNDCSDVVCGLQIQSSWSYSKRGCYIDGECIGHLQTWKNKECDTEKCYVTISKKSGPRVRTRQIASGCRDANNNCRDKYEKWDEPSMDSLNRKCPDAYKAEATCSSNGLVLKYVDAC